MSRKPKIGDFIYFEVEKHNGKSKAINCCIEGEAAKAKQTPNISGPNDSLLESTFLIPTHNLRVTADSIAAK